MTLVSIVAYCKSALSLVTFTVNKSPRQDCPVVQGSSKNLQRIAGHDNRMVKACTDDMQGLALDCWGQR